MMRMMKLILKRLVKLREITGRKGNIKTAQIYLHGEYVGGYDGAANI